MSVAPVYNESEVQSEMKDGRRREKKRFSQLLRLEQESGVVGGVNGVLRPAGLRANRQKRERKEMSEQEGPETQKFRHREGREVAS